MKDQGVISFAHFAILLRIPVYGNSIQFDIGVSPLPAFLLGDYIHAYID
jgi:hypothetical protein